MNASCFMPASYNGSTKDSDSFGGSSILSAGAKSSLTKRTGMLIKNECEHGRLLLRQAESLKGN